MVAAEISLGEIAALAGAIIAAIGLASVALSRALTKIEASVSDGLDKVNTRIDQHMTSEEEDRDLLRQEVSSLRSAVSYIAGKAGLPPS